MLRRGALVLVTACLALPAAAQQTLTDVDAIGRCLCQRQDVDARSTAVASARQALDQARADSARLAADVEHRRPQVQVKNDDDIAAFTDLLRRSEESAARINAEQLPAYNAAVAGYNRSLDIYGAACAGK